jgi:hypothetical protein
MPNVAHALLRRTLACRVETLLDTGLHGDDGRRHHYTRYAYRQLKQFNWEM